jgi:hypothetical protein
VGTFFSCLVCGKKKAKPLGKELIYPQHQVTHQLFLQGGDQQGKILDTQESKAI